MMASSCLGCHTGHHDWELTSNFGLVWRCKKCGELRKFKGINDEILKDKVRRLYDGI